MHFYLSCYSFVTFDFDLLFSSQNLSDSSKQSKVDHFSFSVFYQGMNFNHVLRWFLTSFVSFKQLEFYFYFNRQKWVKFHPFDDTVLLIHVFFYVCLELWGFMIDIQCVPWSVDLTFFSNSFYHPLLFWGVMWD